MAQDTSIQFGQDPPLFSKPPNWVPPAVHTPPHSRPSSAQADDTFQAHNPIHGCAWLHCRGFEAHVVLCPQNLRPCLPADRNEWCTSPAGAMCNVLVLAQACQYLQQHRPEVIHEQQSNNT